VEYIYLSYLSNMLFVNLELCHGSGGCQSVTAETWVQSQASTCGILWRTKLC